MRKNLFGSFGLASVFVATALIGLETQIAAACSGGGSSGSNLSHGSSIGSGSVTVCVGSSGGSSGSSSTQTITKTVIVKVPEKTKPAPKKAPKVSSKPAPKPAPITAPITAPVSCPSAAQLASMPRSADAAERWVSGACSSPARVTAAPKIAPKVSVKPKQQYETRTITETITVEIPGFSYSNSDEAQFYPNPLRAVMAPEKIVGVRQFVSFSSNPASHYGISQILGRQAQVHFVPIASGWSFSDGMTSSGADTDRFFETAGKYQAKAWVSYQVSYRLLGETSWQPVDGQLTVDSNTLEVLVGASNLKGDDASQGALLVGADCEGRPLAFGCYL